MATTMLKGHLDELDIPTVRESLDQIVAGRRSPASLPPSADMNRVAMDDLYEGIKDVISASDFIEMTEGAQLLFLCESRDWTSQGFIRSLAGIGPTRRPSQALVWASPNQEGLPRCVTG